MQENLLIGFIIAALQEGLTANGISGVSVKQDYQPTTQGASTPPSIILHKTAFDRYGYPKKYDTWNDQTLVMTHTEEQFLITTFQINATAIQDPANTTQLTAGDYVDLAAAILNSEATRVSLLSNGIQVERITSGRHTFFKDDKARFEADPSYDCSFIHLQVINSQIPVANPITVTTYPLL